MLTAREIIIINLDGLLLADRIDVENGDVPALSEFKILDSAHRNTVKWEGTPISMLPFLPEEWLHQLLTNDIMCEESIRNLIWSKQGADTRLIICSRFEKEDYKKASIKLNDIVKTPEEALKLVNKHLVDLGEKDTNGIVRWVTTNNTDQALLNEILTKHGAKAHQYKYASL